MTADKDSLIRALKESIEEKDILLAFYEGDLRYKKDCLEKLDAILTNVLNMVQYCIAHQKQS